MVDKSRYSKGDNSLQREIQVLCKVSHGSRPGNVMPDTWMRGKQLQLVGPCLFDRADRSGLCCLLSCPLCMSTPLHGSGLEHESLQAASSAAAQSWVCLQPKAASCSAHCCLRSLSQLHSGLQVLQKLCLAVTAACIAGMLELLHRIEKRERDLVAGRNSALHVLLNGMLAAVLQLWCSFSCPACWILQMYCVDPCPSALLQVQHPNCIKLFAVYITPRKVYLITELVTGGELLDRRVDAAACCTALCCLLLSRL